MLDSVFAAKPRVGEVSEKASERTGAARRKLQIYRITACVVLLIACYFPVILMTGRTIAFSEDMAYAVFAPVVALVIAWLKRAVLLHPQSSANPWSIPLLAIGCCLGVVAAVANSSTLSRIALLLSIAGCILLLAGFNGMKRLGFPLGLLLFTFPIPDVLYGEMTQPLQLIATRLSEFILELGGFSVIREGNLLHLTYMTLSVAEACAGLRSLTTLVFFCIVYGYFFEKRLWLRITIVLLAIPSATLVNALRITTTGILGKYRLEWTEGVYHEITGWLAFALGFLLVLGAHVLLRRIYLNRQARLAQGSTVPA